MSDDDCSCSHPGGGERCPQHGVDAPVDPHEGDCPHCNGEGYVEAGDQYVPLFGLVATVVTCEECDGEGQGTVDLWGVCAEACCLQFPWAQRIGSADVDRSAPDQVTEVQPPPDPADAWA